MNRLFSLILVLVLSLSLAQESGFVQEDAHEHGAALLNVVLDGETLSMELVSPAVNLVGFEYEPSTDEEVQAVEDTLAQLEDATTLFTPAEAAGCELTSAETEHLITDEEGHEEEHGDEEHGEENEGEEEHSEKGEEHGEEDHEEGEEHGNEEEGDEEHEGEEQEGEEHSEDEEHADEEHSDEEHAKEEGAQHSEFHATYSFSCSSPDALNSVDLSELFALYPGIEDLDVQYVLPSGQGAAELGAGSTELSF